MADWQAIGGDTCDQFSADNFVFYNDTDCCSNSSIYTSTSGTADILTVDSGGFNHSDLYENVPFTVDFFQVKTCTQCNPVLTQMMPMCMHDICCLVEVDLDELEELNCYWKRTEGCVTLVARQDLIETLQAWNGSSFKFNSSVFNSPAVVRNKFLLMTDPDEKYSTTCLNMNCSLYQSNSKDYRYLFTNSNTQESSCISSTSASCMCEAFSGSPYHCFWNPNSRITGEHCVRCKPVCRSEDHTINFAQLIVGIVLFSPGFPMARIVISVIASDALGSASQVS